MSVTKRTRAEVLRRDHNTCRYCGSKAPDVAITIDHVVPIALGGDDSPANLVAACRDCNAGKSSVHPDAPLVQDVSQAALVFRNALNEAIAAEVEVVGEQLQAVQQFLQLWKHYVPQHRINSYTLPDEVDSTVIRWHQMGITDEVFEYAIRIAMGKKDVVGSGKFLYTAGIIWNIIRKAEESIAPSPSLGPDSLQMAYEDGYADGAEQRGQAVTNHYVVRHMADELLMRIVDGEPVPAWTYRARKVA